MTNKKPWRLNERVKFKSEDMLGTIIETGYNAIKIRWDDGEISIFQPDMYNAIESVRS